MERVLIVGAGYAGAVSARILANTNKYKVTLIDKRQHIGGNMYDKNDNNGIIIHQYGPHISVMNEKSVYDFLSGFTQWVPYHHRVNAEIDGIEVPLPINFTSIDLLFPIEKAIAIKDRLQIEYKGRINVPILEMRKSSNKLIQEFSDFIFEKVFFHYTSKMWGLVPDEIDPSVTGRVPIRLSYDNRHFLHKYQVMPKDGFTKIFEKMLDHPNIQIKLGTLASDILTLKEDTQEIYICGERFEGILIYTGALDELFHFSQGELPYRSLEFEFQSWAKDYIQDTAVLNWPDSRAETRRTEMKRLTGQKKYGITTTIVERPGAYKRGDVRFNEPLYPINRPECKAIYQKYLDRLNRFPQIIPIGRLAEYQYYNMEAVILRAMTAIQCLLEKQ